MRVDKTVLNTMNKQSIINIIRNNAPVYKAEISRITGLSIPTVMKISDEFIEKGLVREIGKGESSGGKPPQLLEFIFDSYYIIGVDIGTTKIVAIMMDLSAKIIYEHVIPTGVKDSAGEIIMRVVDSIKNVIDNSKQDINRILGIGIGMPGLLDSENGIVLFSPDFGWENVDLIGPLKSSFNLPIILENVTRSMAMGEKWFGLGKGIDNFICINLGYGIGSAIVVDGELYKGSSGSSGEFGHMTLEKNGPMCECGNYGCLEALASANAIAKKAKFYIEKGAKTSILNLVNGDINKVEAITVFDAARAGDTLASDIIRDATEYMGIAIASIINFFDPELIILEGGVSRSGDILVKNIERVISLRQMKYAGRQTNLVISQLGPEAAAIGAASFLLKRLIENGGEVEFSFNSTKHEFKSR